MNKTFFVTLCCLFVSVSGAHARSPHKYSDWVRENDPGAEIFKQKMEHKKITPNELQDAFASSVNGVVGVGEASVKVVSLFHKDYAVTLQQTHPHMIIGSDHKSTIRFKKEDVLNLRKRSQVYQLLTYDEKELNSVLHENLITTLNQYSSLNYYFEDKMADLLETSEKLRDIRNLKVEWAANKRSKNTQTSDRPSFPQLILKELNAIHALNAKLENLMHLIDKQDHKICKKLNKKRNHKVIKKLENEHHRNLELYHSLGAVKNWSCLLDKANKLELARQIGILKEVEVTLKLHRSWRDALLDPRNVGRNIMSTILGS